jgi:DNA-binding PadR family transcriptional regulator
MDAIMLLFERSVEYGQRAVDQPRLTPVSYVVLGLLAQNGPSTPYELKAAAGRSIGNFWSFPHTQLYTEPERLSAAGLLREKQEPSGRRRRVFTITAAGKRALRAWLHESAPFSRELRDIGMLKLFFGGLVEPGDVVALATEQEKGHRAKLQEFEALEREGRPDGDEHRRAVLRMGLLYERAAIRFWAEVADGALPRPDSP